MANKWIITRDCLHEQGENAESAVGVSSPRCNVTLQQLADDPEQLPFRFRLYDDDRELYYEGRTNDNESEAAFSPLDDFGMPHSGCTAILYWQPEPPRWPDLFHVEDPGGGFWICL